MVRAKCQLHAMEHLHHRNARVTALKTGQIEFYTQAAEEIETEIRKLAEEDRELKEKVDRITKVKGLGLITVVTVLCETNGFRLFDNIRQAVSYAGLDVVLKESGKFKGRTGISKRGMPPSGNACSCLPYRRPITIKTCRSFTQGLSKRTRKPNERQLLPVCASC
ncbi:Transposase IS116/IS110/IS902 family protein [Bacteroidales bacterium Barb6XT]|nr:Transposase IS116/IS110/IS902 family protein [Bacteroidales bacterium Barb6XT]